MHQITINTRKTEQFLEITDKIQQLVQESGLKNGLAFIFCPHTTCGLTINEHADPDVTADILTGLTRIVPVNQTFAHREGNSPAHIKASLLGSSVAVMVENGRLLLGTWQGIFLGEFDGPRTRRLWVKFIETDKD